MRGQESENAMSGSILLNNSTEQEKIKSLKDTWSEWLNGYNWDWWVTLTFRDKVITKTANRKWNRWLRGLENELNDELGYFRVTELQKRRQVLHFHALMLNMQGLRRLTWMDEWNRIAGYARIYPYDKTRGAHYYLCKYISKELSAYKLGGKVLKT